MGTNHGGVNFGRRLPPIGGQYSTPINSLGKGVKAALDQHRLQAVTLSGSGHIANPSHLYARIGDAGGAKFWYHGLRNCFITVAERDLLLPRTLTKRLVNHARPGDVTEGYAADWTIGQLQDPAQRIADRIEALMNGSATDAATAGSFGGHHAARTAASQ